MSTDDNRVAESLLAMAVATGGANSSSLSASTNNLDPIDDPDDEMDESMKDVRTMVDGVVVVLSAPMADSGGGSAVVGEEYGRYNTG